MPSSAEKLVKEVSTTDGLVVLRVPVHQIRPNPHQPRKEFDEMELHTLRVAIRADKQLMPITLRPVNDMRAQQDGVKYEIIDGERRWRAAKLEDSGITHLDAIIRDCQSDEQYRYSCALNSNRVGHTPYEELLMVHRLVKVLGYTQTYASILLGKNKVWVSQRILAHERLCQSVMLALKEGKISITAATTLAKLNHDDQLIQLNRYLIGGTIATIKTAVHQATVSGTVQGGVRKQDATDYRRFLEITSVNLSQRLDRLENIGVSELKKSLKLLPSEKRRDFFDALEEQKDRLVNLIEQLKG